MDIAPSSGHLSEAFYRDSFCEVLRLIFTHWPLALLILLTVNQT